MKSKQLLILEVYISGDFEDFLSIYKSFSK